MFIIVVMRSSWETLGYDTLRSVAVMALSVFVIGCSYGVAGHSAGQDGLLLVAVDGDALGNALRYEPSRGGDLFPHLYGPLPVAAVRSVRPLPLGPEGRHLFPDGDAP